MDTIKTETAQPAHTETASDIVSQSEVESLLAQVGGGDSPQGDAATAAVEDHKRGLDSARPHHFRELSSLSAGELRKLRLRHEEFIRSLAARLSIHLRIEVGLQMSKLETVHFQKFIEGISNPTYLTLFRLDPLQGTCLLDVQPKLGLCIVDRELGGPGQCLEEARPLSEIESRLLSRVIEIITSEWCSFWSDLSDLRPMQIAHENSGDFVRTCSPDTMILSLGVDVQIGEQTGQIQFCFPCATLEPLIVKLNSSVRVVSSQAGRAPALPKWNPTLDNVEIPVTAELPEMKVTARQLAQLKPGDALILTPEMFAQVQICLAKKPKFIATLGTNQNQRWAARIIRPVTP